MSRVEADVLLGGRYRLTRKMATGGMGQVWEAEDTVLHRAVAIKVLSEELSQDARSAERFRREAQAAAGLSHPNVAGVFDYGEDDGTQFIVMELVEGETLADRLAREGSLGPAEAARVAAEIAAALEAAHTAGIVHRDVKPGNVMLTPQGEVKVLDFGIAAAAGAHLTATGFTIGTAAYLSPEQAAGKRATPASDVYALGVVLFEMLAGRPPFTGETPVAVATAHVSQEPPSLSEVAPSVPSHLALLCRQALSKDPTLRPPTAGALRHMLLQPETAPEPPTGAAADAEEASLDQATAVLPPADATAILPVEAQPVSAHTALSQPAKAGPTDRRRSWLIVAAILVALSLIALLLSSVLGGDLLSGTRIKVPEVAGMSLAAAENALRDRGLLVGDVKRVEGPTDTVVRTDPPGGESVAAGTHVTLYVGPASASTDRGDEGGKGKDKRKGGGGD
jgi:eukaryotic-like serine/threonine-protein kinase